MVALILPKKYLSYSQWDLWRKSKPRYRKEYFENGEKLSTKYLTFGSFIAKMIEENNYKDILPNLIVYPLHEYEVKVEIEGVPIFSKIDNCKEDFSSFRDDKTGKTPWTLAKAQKSEQLLFYATVLRKKTGKMPKNAFIDWIETIDDKTPKSGFHNDSKVKITGRVESFERLFDKRELDRMEKEIVKTAHDISRAYQEFINEI